MINQDLTDITRGLQHAAATTNSLVAEQYIRILSQYFETLPDGTLQAKMVRVQISEEYYAMVPLVSMVSPSGLALDKMRVELSLKVEQAEEKRASILDLKHGNPDEGEGDMTRSAFAVSMSPRSKASKRRPSDNIDIVLEFVARETPESVMRVIETYTNLIQPIKMPEDGKMPPSKIINLKTGAGMTQSQQDQAVEQAQAASASPAPDVPATPDADAAPVSEAAQGPQAMPDVETVPEALATPEVPVSPDASLPPVTIPAAEPAPASDTAALPPIPPIQP